MLHFLGDGRIVSGHVYLVDRVGVGVGHQISGLLRHFIQAFLVLKNNIGLDKVLLLLISHLTFRSHTPSPPITL